MNLPDRLSKYGIIFFENSISKVFVVGLYSAELIQFTYTQFLPLKLSGISQRFSAKACNAAFNSGRWFLFPAFFEPRHSNNRVSVSVTISLLMSFVLYAWIDVPSSNFLMGYFSCKARTAWYRTLRSYLLKESFSFAMRLSCWTIYDFFPLFFFIFPKYL